MKSLIIGLLLCSCFFVLYSQSQEQGYPEIGKRCPDFVLKDLVNYPAKKASLKNLKGKFVILDFWGSGCASCVQSFTKLDRFQREHEKRLQIILVGHDDRYIRPLYKTFQKKFELKLPAAFDTTVFKKFGITGVPVAVWIDSSQIVRAVTTHPDDLNAGNVSSFLAGNSFRFEDFSIKSKRERA